MAAKNIKGLRVLFLNIMALMVVLIMCGDTHAKIPEPDNIIYGIAGGGAESVVLEVEGEQIASYMMGDNPDAGEFYVLRVPLDSLDPREPGSAQPGDMASIFINDEITPAATVVIGERGSIQKVHLGGADSDGDDLPDSEEAYLGTNPANGDTDGDGLSDSDEVDTHDTDPLLADSDGDGFTDFREVFAGSDPLDEDDAPVVYVDAGNTSGIMLGTEQYPYQTITQGAANALDGYVVIIASGNYNESVIIDKNIKLMGESPTTTVIDTNDQIAVDFDYDPGEIDLAGIERLSVKNAAVGIMCRTGASPLIRNNIITNVADYGIDCDVASGAKIINNTIADNTTATAIKSDSDSISIINNIISDNYEGIDCEGGGLTIDYNNIWNSLSGNDYVGTTVSGLHDISADPLFASENDFHLMSTSLCLDAGDPVEILGVDYGGGSSLTVDETTNLAVDNRIWITDASNTETDIIATFSSTSIGIAGEFMNSYETGDGAYIYTDTSDATNEPFSAVFRIDIGAYGNTEEAGPANELCIEDLDCDGISDSVEIESCTDPDDADSDDDGIADGVEDVNHDGILDSNETDPCDMDSDGDGIQDGTEMGYTADDIDADTDTAVFIPDADPNTTTDPLNPDTDYDGIYDGDEDENCNGAVDQGETDPLTSNPARPKTMPWIPLLLLDE